jgi:vacuole morphology and inheritance protein 14
VDKIYEKRKAAALELERYVPLPACTRNLCSLPHYACRQVRDLNVVGDQRKIAQIIDQLVDMFTNVNNALHVRNGGLIGLAGAAISLQLDIASYMGRFVEPILVCFTDPENRIRYFSAECLYNIAKVSKGEILVYFNPIFDALSKVSEQAMLQLDLGDRVSSHLHM